MKKVSKPSGVKKPAPARKRALAKSVRPMKAPGGAGLAEVVAQLSRAAEKLTRGSRQTGRGCHALIGRRRGTASERRLARGAIQVKTGRVMCGRSASSEPPGC